MGKYNKKVENPKEDTHKRFCRVCRKQTYAFWCCGQHTALVNMTSTIGDKIIIRK